MKLDLLSTSVRSLLLVAASVTLVACARKPEPVTPDVIAANTTPPPVTKAAPADAAPPTSILGGLSAVHREKGEECSREKVAGNVEARGPQGDVPLLPVRAGTCSKDADCTAGKNGRCSMIGGGRMPAVPGCVYDACYVDADCGAKRACDCGGSPSEGHSCMQGNCAIDADCGKGGLCSPSLGSCGNYGGVIGNFCHTPNDECASDEDCMGKPGGYCGYSQEAAKWQCSYGHCVG